MLLLGAYQWFVSGLPWDGFATRDWGKRIKRIHNDPIVHAVVSEWKALGAEGSFADFFVNHARVKEHSTEAQRGQLWELATFYAKRKDAKEAGLPVESEAYFKAYCRGFNKAYADPPQEPIWEERGDASVCL